MMMLHKPKTLLLSIICLLAVLAGCKKYYIETEVHDPKFEGNIMQYMEGRKPFFDSTLTIIKLAGLADVVSKENITFFAPPSGSVFKSVKRLNVELRATGKDTVSKLTQIKSQVWRNILSQYIFKGSNRLKDYPQRDTLSYLAYPGQGYTSYGGRIMNVGVIFNDAVVYNDKGAEISRVAYAGYRQLYLAYIPDLSNPQVSLVNIPVATSDIQPNNGVLHVLNKLDHNFGFNTNVFIEQAISAGIDPATP
ncbi:fasciclin domain-containing protein [Pedobacter rhizosphaerae]|uniref:Fasciclin domain-containing protein n=1 Tax=Pedobacter rhizosphaerae TaxID=390241 RepID=A0A1H9MKB1_9SPHI|nr:fasciclin domain-containing protein [Pedobacter rhizosphaerae]SER24058.1 Fasciclin domain-containing protein [Pedobacter rhizosphaerae]